MARTFDIAASFANGIREDGICLQRDVHRLWRITRRRDLAFLLIGIAFFTSSFDIFLSLDIGGFNLRVSQLALLPVVGAYLCSSMAGFRGNVPKGGVLLLLWVGLLGIFTLRSSNLLNGLGYEAYLCFDALIVFALAYFAKSANDIRWLYGAYLASFVFMAVVGLLQFGLYLVGIDFFVAQEYRAGIARINGFCFEPSYYATYMLMGFVAFAYLWEKNDISLLSRRGIVFGLLVISAALVFSTSRMGLLMMILWVALRLGINCFRFFFARQRFSAGKMFTIFVATAALIAVLFALSDESAFFWRGISFSGTNDWSSSARIDGLTNCLMVFASDPLFGYGLGGVDPALAQHAGIDYIAGSNGAAMSIVGELLVASGAVGLAPLVAFFCVIVFSRSRKKDYPNRSMQRALIWALVFELVILCMNQNILRVYVWIHIAMVCVSWIKTSQLEGAH